MRIVIDTEAQEPSPAVTSSAGSVPRAEPVAAGSAPTAMQGEELTSSYSSPDQPIAAGAPSAELVAAIAAAAPVFAAAQQADGGSAPAI